MSASHPLIPSASSSSSEPKKKFGKNLNKLTKPPPPTFTAGAASSSIAASSSRLNGLGSSNSTTINSSSASSSGSRNGLLLLSTKRSHSSFGASSSVSTTSGVGGGSSSLLSKKVVTTTAPSFGSTTTSSSSMKGAPKPLNTPSLRSESTYDSLLNTASGTNTTSTGGWKNNTNTETPPTPPPPAWGLGDKSTNAPTPVASSNAVVAGTTTVPTLAPKGRVSAGYLAPVPAVYGENHNNNHNNNHHESHPERAALPPPRRHKQHERMRRMDSYENDGYVANARSKQESLSAVVVSEHSNADVVNVGVPEREHSLERFMMDSKPTPKPSLRNKASSLERGKFNQEESQRNAKPDVVVVEQVNSAHVEETIPTKAPPPSPQDHHDTTTATTSRVVDDQVEYMKRRARERAEQLRAEEEARVNEQKERATRRLQKLEEKIRSSRKPAPPDIVLERLGGGRKQPGGLFKKKPEPPTTSTTTRALFDPNRTYSSLVGGSNSQQRQQADAAPKAPTPPPPEEDQPPPILNLTVKHDSFDDPPPPVSVIQLAPFKERNQRSTSGGPRMLFDPKSGSMVQAPDKKEETVTKPRRKIKKPKEERRTTTTVKQRHHPNRKLPRTRGVLYHYTPQGHYACADGCDADLGYGAHSVPGGRVRNPAAPRWSGVPSATAQTTTTYDVPSHMRVKANEKLSVLGLVDSLELQATAHSWVPSEAALAVVAAAKRVDEEEEEEEEEESDEANDVMAEDYLMKIIGDTESQMESSDEVHSESSFFGLGFDPAENMDSMIKSPTLEPGDEPVNLSTLSLEPANGNLFSPLGSPSRFLGSSTWGTTTEPGSLNWELDPSSSAQSALFGFSALTNHEKGTWGSSRIRNGMVGLGGTPLNANASEGTN